LVGGSHKHYHLESLATVAIRKVVVVLAVGVEGGGEPRRQVTQEVDRTVCPAGVR